MIDILFRRFIAKFLFERGLVVDDHEVFELGVERLA
jgi:hypothetical protein